MHGGGRLAVLFVALVVGGGAALGVAAADGTADATVPAHATQPANATDADSRARIDPGHRTSHDSIVVTQVYRLTPDRPGAVDVEWHFEIPDRVSDVRTRLPPAATNVRSAEFSRTENDVYEWSGDTSTASITFTVEANESVERTGPEADDGRYGFVDAGEWALIRRQPIANPGYTHPRGRDPGVTIQNRTASEGVVGSGMVFLGAHRVHERSAHGQTFRLLVPGAATLAADRTAILDSVADASDRLRVGDRDGTVLMIAAPTNVPWGVRGRQLGDRDFYVLADERLDTPDNVWLHEYVHTRQDVDRTKATRWFSEGSAEYYAALLALEQDHVDFEPFRDQLQRGTRRQLDDVRLVDPGTWRPNDGDYLKGALVAGEIDRRVRTATDGGATLQDLFRRMNGADSPVEQADFLRYVERVGGEGVVDRARRFTETTARPEVWTRSTHQDAFGALPASFGYRLPATDGFRVRSGYRNGSLEEFTLVSGETLAVDVTVSNVGGTAGEYALNVTVDGRTVTNRSGRLEAGASTTETVEHTFETPGTYRLGAGEESVTVRVDEPATPVVTDLSVDRQRVKPGESVTVAATVENAADRPGAGRFAIRLDGTPIADEPVRMAAGERTRVTATATLPEEGTTRFEAGDRSVTVTVSAADGTAPDSDTPAESGASGPGMDIGAALAALAVVALAALARRW